MCFGYLLESPQWGDSNKYPKHFVLIRDSLQEQIYFNGMRFWLL